MWLSLVSLIFSVHNTCERDIRFGITEAAVPSFLILKALPLLIEFSLISLLSKFRDGDSIGYFSAARYTSERPGLDVITTYLLYLRIADLQVSRATCRKSLRP